MKYNILISGAYGFIGKNFVYSLLNSSEYNLYLISRNKVINSTSSFINICCDIKDLDSIKMEFQNIEIDFILHFASKSTNEIAEKNPYDTIQSNVVGINQTINGGFRFTCSIQFMRQYNQVGVTA